MTRSRPSDVETLACAAASEYASRWVRRIASQQPDDTPWLVDGFAGADLQRAALRGATVVPPAAAFARAAGQALGGEARIVLMEEDPVLLGRVEDELRTAGAEDRLRRTGDPASVEPGEIVLVEASLASVADRLANAIGGTRALVRLAPLAAKALPWIVLEPLAMLSSVDLLIRLPQEDFTRIGRFSGPLADFPPHLRRVAESCSAMFADPRHGWLLAWREAARAGGEPAALAGAVERLRTMLAVAGDERTVSAARVEAGGAAVHLLLSAPDAEHATELDAAITDAGAPPPAAPKRGKSAKASAASPAPPAEALRAEASPPKAAPADGSPSEIVAAEPPSASLDAPIAEAAPEDATPSGIRAAELASALPDAAPTEAAPANAPTVAASDASPAEAEPADASPAASPDASPAEAEPKDDSPAGPAPSNPADASSDPADEPASAAPAAASDAGPTESPAPDELTSASPEHAPAAKGRRARKSPAPPPSAAEEPAAMLDLFALAPVAEPAPRAPDLRAVADDLLARHVGQTVAFSDLIASSADSSLAPDHVRSALGMLKRAGRAAFRSLDADSAEVEFRAEAAAPPAVPAPKPRQTRQPAPDLLGLFDDPAPPAEEESEAEDGPLHSAAGAGAPFGEPAPVASDDIPLSVADAIFDDALSPSDDEEIPLSIDDAIFPDDEPDASPAKAEADAITQPAEPNPSAPVADASPPAAEKPRRRKK